MGVKNDEVIQFCDEWLEAWNGGQPEKLISFYDEQAYYSDPSRTLGIRGKADLLIYFSAVFARYPGWHWKRKEIFPQRNGFILKWQAWVKAGHGSGFFGMDIVDLNRGKILRNEVYFDPGNLIPQQGIAPVR